MQRRRSMKLWELGGRSPRGRALHKKSWAVIDRPYSLGSATVGALYERPRSIFCAKPITKALRHKETPYRRLLIAAFLCAFVSLWSPWPCLTRKGFVYTIGLIIPIWK